MLLSGLSRTTSSGLLGGLLGTVGRQTRLKLRLVLVRLEVGEALWREVLLGLGLGGRRSITLRLTLGERRQHGEVLVRASDEVLERRHLLLE